MSRISVGRIDWYYKNEPEREPSGSFKEHWLSMNLSQIQLKFLFK